MGYMMITFSRCDGDNSGNDMGVLDGAGTSGIDGNKGKKNIDCFNHSYISVTRT